MFRWILFITLLLTTQSTKAQTDFVPSLVLFQDEEAVPISYNVVTEAEFISDNLEGIYEFEGQIGDIIIVRVYGSAVAEVMLFSPDGVELDRQLPLYGPQVIINWRTLTENGVYQIIVRGSLEGAYSVSVSLREPPNLVLNTGGNTERDYFPLYNITEMDFVFNGNSGQSITLAVNSDNFDPLLMLIAPDGRTIAEDDDSGGNLNALLWDFPLPQTGTYRIIVRRYMNRDSGAFYVHLRDADNPNRIEYNEMREVSVSVDNQTSSVLIFHASAGDVIAVHTDDSLGNAVIRLQDSRNEVIRDSSSIHEFPYSPMNPNPYGMMNRVVLSREGDYRLTITPTEDITEMIDINLWVELLGTMSLDNSEQIPLIVHISDKSPVITLNFSHDNTGVDGTGRISITQVGPSQSFRLTFLAEDEIVAQIEFVEMLDIGSFATEFYFPLQSVAQNIQLEIFGEGTAFFTISATAIYGMG